MLVATCCLLNGATGHLRNIPWSVPDYELRNGEEAATDLGRDLATCFGDRALPASSGWRAAGEPAASSCSEATLPRALFDEPFRVFFLREEEPADPVRSARERIRQKRHYRWVRENDGAGRVEVAVCVRASPPCANVLFTVELDCSGRPCTVGEPDYSTAPDLWLEPAVYLAMVALCYGAVLLPLFALAAAFLFRGFRSVVDRAIVRRALRRTPATTGPRSLAPFVTALVLQSMVALGVRSAIVAGELSSATFVVAVWGFMAALGLAAAVGFALHYLPNQSRSAKYAWLCIALGTWDLLGELFIAYGWVQATPLAPLVADVEPWMLLASATVWQIAILFAAAALAWWTHRYRVGAARAGGTLLAAFQLSSRTWALALVALGSFVVGPTLVLLYLVWRFFAGEAVAAHPIVYLRPFDEHDTVWAFGRVVAPVASTRGAVVALVAEKQGPLELMADTPLWFLSKATVVADAVWREWVTNRLRVATAAVLDVSAMTPNVEWELREARSLLGPTRIVVLHRADAETPPVSNAGLLEGVHRVPYSLANRRSIRDARARLRTVLATIGRSATASAAR